jgi:hypothetical protein
MGQTVPNNQQTTNQYSLFNSQVLPRTASSSIINPYSSQATHTSNIKSINPNSMYKAAPLNSSQVMQLSQIQQQLQPIGQYPRVPTGNIQPPQPVSS